MQHSAAETAPSPPTQSQQALLMQLQARNAQHSTMHAAFLPHALVAPPYACMTSSHATQQQLMPVPLHQQPPHAMPHTFAATLQQQASVR
eukprot:3604291-Pleurochrysis_carterae.AAC.1